MLDVLCALLVALFSLGAGSSMTVCYYDSRDAGARRLTVSTTFVLLLISSSVLLAVALLARGNLSQWTLGRPEHPLLVLLSVATSAVMILQQPFSMRLQFEDRASRLVTINLVSTVLLVAGSIIAVVVLGRGVRGLWEARLLAHSATLLLFMLRFPVRGLLRFRPATARELLRLGLPMVPAFGAIFVLLQGNRYILSLFEEMDTVGVYSVGVQLGMAMGLAVSAFSTAWTPYFMSFGARRREAPPVLARVTTYYVLGFGALSLFFFLGGRAALLVLAAPAFHEGYLVAGWAATAQWMIGLFNVLMPPCTYAREIQYSSWIQVAAAILAIGLNLVLIPLWGMLGAGLALAAGPAMMAAMLWAWNRSQEPRYLQIRYERSRIFGFFGLYAAIAFLATRERDWSLAFELALASLAGIAVAGLVWGLLSREERAGLQGMARRLRIRTGSIFTRTASLSGNRDG